MEPDEAVYRDRDGASRGGVCRLEGGLDRRLGTGRISWDGRRGRHGCLAGSLPAASGGAQRHGENAEERTVTNPLTTAHVRDTSLQERLPLLEIGRAHV